VKKLIIALLILTVIIALRFSTLGEFLTFDNLTSNKEMLVENVENNYIFAVGTFILTYIIVIGLSIPGATILTIASGFLFGSIKGTLYTNIGATSGAIIVFLLTRYLIGDWVQQKYKSKLKQINKEISKNGHSYLLTLRLVPIFPFFLINLAAGVSKIRLKTFIWTTALGIIPGSFAYAFAGKQLSNISNVKEILSVNILIALLLLALFAILPVILKKIKVINNEV